MQVLFPTYILHRNSSHPETQRWATQKPRDGDGNAPLLLLFKAEDVESKRLLTFPAIGRMSSYLCIEIARVKWVAIHMQLWMRRLDFHLHTAAVAECEMWCGSLPMNPTQHAPTHPTHVPLPNPMAILCFICQFILPSLAMSSSINL